MNFIQTSTPATPYELAFAELRIQKLDPLEIESIRSMKDFPDFSCVGKVAERV